MSYTLENKYPYSVPSGKKELTKVKRVLLQSFLFDILRSPKGNISTKIFAYF